MRWAAAPILGKFVQVRLAQTFDVLASDFERERSMDSAVAGRTPSQSGDRLGVGV